MASLHIAASQMDATKPCEWNDPSSRTHAVFENPPIPVDGLFHLSDEPGLGLRVNEAELANAGGWRSRTRMASRINRGGPP